MGKRGPKKTPTELKVLRGGRTNGREKEPKPKRGIPAPPWTAEQNEVALEEWNRITPELHRLGLLTGVDRAALVAYCESWSTWQAAQTTLEQEGLYHTIAAGTKKPHPAVKVARDARLDCIRFAAHFGATPSSRSEVTAAPAKAPNPFSELLHGGGSKDKDNPPAS